MHKVCVVLLIVAIQCAEVYSAKNNNHARVQQGALRLELKSLHQRIEANACLDRATNCDKYIDFCTTPSYDKLLRGYCAATCGFCLPTGDACKDHVSGALACAKWKKQGLCKSKRSKHIATVMCPKTCSLCGDSIPSTPSKPISSDCNERNKYLSDPCAIEICKDPNERKKDGPNSCKSYCTGEYGVHLRKVCDCQDPTLNGATGATKGSWCPACVGATDNAVKYSPFCIAETCKAGRPERMEEEDPNEMFKPGFSRENRKGRCKGFCGMSNNYGFPACSCFDSNGVYSAAAWCPALDASCAGGKLAGDNCLKETCKAPVYKSTKECIDYCTAHPTEDTCKCTANDNVFESWCLEKTCVGRTAATQNGGCPHACKRDVNKDNPGCKCTPDKMTGEHKADWCMGWKCAGNKDDPDCKAWCDLTENKWRNECV